MKKQKIFGAGVTGKALQADPERVVCYTDANTGIESGFLVRPCKPKWYDAHLSKIQMFQLIPDETEEREKAEFEEAEAWGKRIIVDAFGWNLRAYYAVQYDGEELCGDVIDEMIADPTKTFAFGDKAVDLHAFFAQLTVNSLPGFITNPVNRAAKKTVQLIADKVEDQKNASKPSSSGSTTTEAPEVEAAPLSTAEPASATV